MNGQILEGPRSRRYRYSSRLIIFFSVTILLSALYSELFRAPNKGTHELNKYIGLFPENYFAGVEGLKITNRISSYEIINKNNKWQIISPRVVPAKGELISRMTNSLQEIQIKKVFEKDPINMANYSLDAPLFSVQIKKAEGKKQTLLVGLMNPIDNTAYATIKGGQAIYLINALKFPIEKLELSELIDSRPMAIAFSNITELSIRKNKVKSRPSLHFIKNQDQTWKNNRNSEINTDKVVEFLQSFTSLKSTIILDDVKEATQKQIDKYLERPLYLVNIKLSNGTEKRYSISRVVHKLEGVQLTPSRNFLIKDQDRNFIFIIDKKHLRPFSLEDRAFQKISIKKLFY